MGAASLRDPSLLQSALGTQFNVATVMGHWQLVLRLMTRESNPVSRTRFAIEARRVCHLAIPPVKNKILFHDIAYFMTLASWIINSKLKEFF